jgi:Flp pilus assembly protein TadD
MQLAQVLADTSRTDGITWGRICGHQFAAFCPDMGESEAVGLAQEIQRRYLDMTDETVSVGVAAFPFYRFGQTAILANARKALVHAGFFGANAVTSFDAVSLNISADSLYQNGDIEGAIAELETAAQIDPHNVNVYNSLGVCYGVNGDFERAIGAFETAIETTPEDVMATYNLGLAYLKQENREKALEFFLRAHSLDGENPDIAGHIGMCYQEKGELDRAIGYLEEAVKKISLGAAVYRALGECYLVKGRNKEAAKLFEKAVKASPRDAKSLNNLAHLYGILGESLEIAIVLAEESVSIERENGRYRCRLGELYMKAGNYLKAEEAFQRAQELGWNCDALIQEVRAQTEGN